MEFEVQGAGEPDSDINVTPLIDIVLVMLIIFMVMTPIQIQEMAVKLPEKTQVVHKSDLPKDQLLVAAYDDGTLALNKRRMSPQELFDQLEHRLKFKKSRVVFVDAHPELPYADVIEVMDIVRDAGAERVALARLKDRGPKPPTQDQDGNPLGGATAPAPTEP